MLEFGVPRFPVRRPPMPARIAHQQAAGYTPQLPLAEIVRQAAHGKAFRGLIQDAQKPQPGDMTHLVTSILDGPAGMLQGAQVDAAIGTPGGGSPGGPGGLGGLEPPPQGVNFPGVFGRPRPPKPAPPKNMLVGRLLQGLVA